MLHRLVEYADKHGIIGTGGFASKRIRFLFIFSSEGHFIKIHDYGKSGELFTNVPDLQFEGDIPKRQFLVDTLDFLALYPPPPEEKNLGHKLKALKEATLKLLNTHGEESDFPEIRSMSEHVMALLEEEQFLKLREEDIKREWASVLKRKGRANKPEIKGFLKRGGVVDAVFSNEEFKRIGKHQYCLRLLEQATSAVPCFGVISKAMNDSTVIGQIHEGLRKQKPAPKNMNNATFAIWGNDGLRILVKENSWREWWESKHKDLSDSVSSVDARCFLSGDMAKLMLKHPKIKGLSEVGGAAQILLISYNQKSMESYGFSQGENAAVSVESSVKYSSALSNLLSRQHHKLAGTEIVYWYSRDIPAGEDLVKSAFEGWGSMFEEDDDIEEDPVQREAQANIDAKKFLQSVVKGERHDLQDVEYFALTLQGNKGRAVVQNWMEGRFFDLAGNIQTWFADLEVPRLSGAGLAKTPKMETLITCLLKERKPKQKYMDWVKPVAVFRDAFWHAAVGGRSFLPENAVRLVLQRLRESMLTDEWENAIDSEGEHMGIRRARMYARTGIIKMYLIRNHNQEVDMVEHEKLKNSVYWLGSLFAELANLQREAHRSDGGANIKSTIVDRFYTTASSCPKLVHGRLIAQSQHHLRKLEAKKPKAAKAIDNRIALISNKIDFDEVPDLLPLPEQSWFALGYYQQIAKNNADKAEAIAKKRNKNNSEQGENQ